jgi:hypothetical protein
MHKTIIATFALTIMLNLNVSAADSTSIEFPKSRQTAVLYSLASTALPMVVGGVMMRNENSAHWGTGISSFGLICGPGVGHIYAVNARRFWTGAATRGIILSSSVAVAVILIDDSSGKDWDESLGNAMLAVAIVGAGVTICTISAIRDIATADNSVDAYNSAHGFQSLTLRPTYLATHKTPGLLLSLTF